MNDQLSWPQRSIIEHTPCQGHMLVLAAPGSGKTRIITERVAYLLDQHKAEPERIIVMTFTDKAAKQLIDRLESRLSQAVQGIWVGTIHSICHRLLEEYGAIIGWGPPFKTYDALHQDEAIRRAATTAGRSLPDTRTCNDIKTLISQRKRLGLSGDEQRRQPPFDSDTVLAIDESYRRLLKNDKALDYDDLILKATELFVADHEAARRIRQRFSYIFVDEFHDLSPDQFALLTCLFPPMMPDRQVMVVADPNQAIYGWRDANAGLMLNAYHTHYHPTTFHLEENYRSAGNLVRAAQQLITSGGAIASGVPVYPDELPIDLVTCVDGLVEADWLARQIKNARKNGRYSYSEIAVLYRNNGRADILESTFLREGIPIQRFQDNRFFNNPDVQATIRYMSLIKALTDETFEPALHWPRVLVDELTMAHLHRLAATESIPLSTLARRIDTFANQVSPLTRTIINDFLAIFDVELAQVADQPIATIIPQLLTVLKRKCSPIIPSVRENLKGVLRSLTLPLEDAVNRLHCAIADGRSIVLTHHGDVDSVAGAVILAHILTHYLGYPVSVRPHSIDFAEGTFRITCGAARPADHSGFGLGIYETPLRTLTYSVSTQAWRIGQMLLMSYETLRNGRFLLYDLETTGTHVRTTEILELAALEVLNGRATEHTFHTMTRPEGRISPAASSVHGITEEQVKNKPRIDEVLSAYLAFLGDATLVGHNVEAFDHPILSRIAQSLGMKPPTGPIIDTCTLARRLFPNNGHRLEALAHQFGVKEAQTHRALDDVRLNGQVFFKLLDSLDGERELDIAGEVLPLVALGIHASGIPLTDYNLWLVQVGARASACGLGTGLREAMLKEVAQPWDLDDDERWLKTLPCHDPEEDQRWVELTQRWNVALKLFHQTFDDHSVASFLRYVELATSIDYRDGDDERVSMMTIHSAKGKEWPFVFIVGVEEDTIPSFHAKTEQEIEEERRVLYVAMTRAKRRLCLSRVATWRGYTKMPSRFLRDIPAALVTERAVRGSAPPSQ